MSRPHERHSKLMHSRPLSESSAMHSMLVFSFALLMSLAAPTVFADHPDVRGVYDGSGNSTLMNCSDPADNGLYSFDVTVNINTQIVENITGNGTLTATIQGQSLREDLNFFGAVTVTGALSGNFNSALYVNELLDSNASGTFTGQVNGTGLTFNVDGADTFGDTCTFTGTYMGTRPNVPPPIVHDQDQDGIADEIDNCPTVSNPEQNNFDGDSLGDVCDTDDDNDGLSDIDEVLQYGTDPYDPDSDDDGVNDGDEVAAGTDPLVDESARPSDAVTAIISSLLLTDTISFSGELGVIEQDAGGAVYSGVPIDTRMFGEINDVTFGGFISDGTTITAFSCCIAAGGLDVANDQAIDASDAALINSLAGTSFVGGELIDLVDIEGDAVTAGGGRIEIGVSYVLSNTAFDDDSLTNYPPSQTDILVAVFFIAEFNVSGEVIYSAVGLID